jgi:hypothetical protein
MKDSILTQFNSLVKQFIDQLIKQFPEDMNLYKLQFSFELSKTDVYWLNLFMDTMRDYEKLIMERNILFLDHKISEQFDLKPYYEKCDEDGKKVIWEFLQILYVTGHSYENYNPNFMKSVEGVAENCEDEFQK